MSAVLPKLLNFIKKSILDLTEDGMVHSFRLYHTSEGRFEDPPIGTYEHHTGDDYEGLAQQVWDEAEADAESRTSGNQRYTLVSFRGEDNQADSQFSFRITAVNAHQALALDSDPPTEGGITSQSMRQSETLHRLLMMGHGPMLERYEMENARLFKQLQDRQEHDINMYQLMDAFNDKKAERDAQLEEQRRRNERIDALVSMAMQTVQQIMPAVVMALATRKKEEPPPAVASEKTETPALPTGLPTKLIEFFSSLGVDEINGTLEALKPENRDRLLELIGSASNTEEPEQETSNGSKEEVDPG